MPAGPAGFGGKLLLGFGRGQRYRIGMQTGFSRLTESRPSGDPRRVYLIGLLLFGLAFLATGFDVFVARHLNVEQLPGDFRRMLGLTELFAHGAGVLLAAWCIWKLSPESRRCLPRLLACAFLPGVAANLLKLSICRLRPAYFVERMPPSILDTWIGALPNSWGTRGEVGTYFASSFPSGHAATAIGLAIGLAWLYPAGRTPFFTVAALASLQRITSGAHWLSDTLVGMALATLIAGSLTTNTRWARRFARFETRGRPIDENQRLSKVA